MALTFWQRFWYGVLGAAGPELVRWSRIASRPGPSDLPAYWPLYVVVLVVSVVGGFFATAWQDDNRVKCVYFGATFPAFIFALAGLAPKLPP